MRNARSVVEALAKLLGETTEDLQLPQDVGVLVATRPRKRVVIRPKEYEELEEEESLDLDSLETPLTVPMEQYPGQVKIRKTEKGWFIDSKDV